MPLADILEANRRFVRDFIGQPVSAEPNTGVAIVTCIDTRLTELILKAMGMKRGDAVIIRNAGNTATPHDNSILRSVLAAIYLVGVREVAVVGHTDCRMVTDVLPVLEAMKRKGVSRDALGNEDPRTFFGLLTLIERNVLDVCEALRSSPLVPEGVQVHGLLIDSLTGALKVLTTGAAERKAAPGAARTGPVLLDAAMIVAQASEALSRPDLSAPMAEPPAWTAAEPISQPAPAPPPPAAAQPEEIPEAMVVEEAAPAPAPVRRTREETWEEREARKAKDARGANRKRGRN